MAPMIIAIPDDYQQVVNTPGCYALYESEPVLGGRHSLLKMGNVLCTPRSAWIEKEMFECYFGEAFANLIKFAQGAPVNLVDPAALQR